MNEGRDESLVNRLDTARRTAWRSPDAAVELTREGPWLEVAAASCGTAVGLAEIGISDGRLDEAIRNFAGARATSPDEVVTAVLERCGLSETGTATISDLERLRLRRLVGESEEAVAKMDREIDAFRTDEWTEDSAATAANGLRQEFPQGEYVTEDDPAVALGIAVGCAERGYRPQALAAVQVFREMQGDMLRVLATGILEARRP